MYSETWPRWGTMRGGECWGHATPVRPTSATASGSSERWLTPTANDGKQVGDIETEMMALYEQGTNVPDTYKRLRSQVAARVAGRMWPTPTKSDADGGPESNDREGGLNLRTAVRRETFPTPTVNDSKNNNPPSQALRNTPPLNVVVGGHLNPTWVEWLMGWPLGWTDLHASAMDRFRQWCASHGVA